MRFPSELLVMYDVEWRMHVIIKIIMLSFVLQYFMVLVQIVLNASMQSKMDVDGGEERFECCFVERCEV
jgi:hypothetical protein